MDNGQWTMNNVHVEVQLKIDSGQWTVDNGQWTMDSGQWTVEMDDGYGHGKMDNGHEY